MCGRYVMITKTETIEKKFNVRMTYEHTPNFNAAPSQQLPIITSEKPKEVQGFNFGYLAPWAKTKYKGLINIKVRKHIKTGR